MAEQLRVDNPTLNGWLSSSRILLTEGLIDLKVNINSE